jgi:hypothetical protein
MRACVCDCTLFLNKIGGDTHYRTSSTVQSNRITEDHHDIVFHVKCKSAVGWIRVRCPGRLRSWKSESLALGLRLAWSMGLVGLSG